MATDREGRAVFDRAALVRTICRRRIVYIPASVTRSLMCTSSELANAQASSSKQSLRAMPKGSQTLLCAFRPGYFNVCDLVALDQVTLMCVMACAFEVRYC